MKLLIISTVGLIYDGITNVITSYLKAMDKSEIEIFVAGTIEVNPVIKIQIEELGGKIIELPNRRNEPVSYAISLTKFIRKKKIDIVHAHGNSGTLAIEMSAAWLGGCKKRIAHSHNTRCDHVKADKILRPILNLFYTDAIACGEDAGKWLFKDKPFFVLKNGRDVNKFKYDKDARQKIREQYQIGESLAIGHVGNFVQQKNHSFVLEIYNELLLIDPNVRLFMIGDGELRDNIEKKALELDIRKNIEFTGNIDNIQEVLSALDAMVLPSFFEGLPLVVMEWQISGLPCIVSDNVTKECGIADDLVDFMSLELNPREWALNIYSKTFNRNRDEDSKYGCFKIDGAGFSITQSAEELRNLYIG